MPWTLQMSHRLKVVELVTHAGKAIDQIKVRKYCEKYLNESSEIYLIGVEFSCETQNIVNFEWEKSSIK